MFIKNQNEILFSRGQMAKITGISKFTIKFWSDCGLVAFTVDPTNGYKYYPLSKLPDLAAANTFSLIGVSIKDQQKLRFCDKDAKLEIFKKEVNKLDKKIEKLLDGRKKMESMIEKMEYLYQKENIGIYAETPDFDCLVRVNPTDTNVMQSLFEKDASNDTYVEFDGNGKEKTSINAIGLKNIQQGTDLLWQKTDNMKFVARVVKKIDEALPDLTKEQLYNALVKEGIFAKCIIYKHLVSVMQNENTCNYFVAYAQY